MTRYNPYPKSFKVTTTLKRIPVKQLFKSEEFTIFSQDGENDGELFMATNPNSTDVRTTTLSPTITGIIGNNYTNFTGTDNSDNIITYTSSDPTGIIAGEEVRISQGVEIYTTTVIEVNGNDIKLDGSELESFVPATDDILIFNHSTWYYICSSSLTKVAVGDMFEITLDDDSSVQYPQVQYVDNTHIGFTISTTNYTASDVVLFEADFKIDGIGTTYASNEYPNGILVKHGTTDSTSTNLTITPATGYDRPIKKKWF